MMVTIAEKIVLLRGEREQLSLEIERLRTRRTLVNAELLGLEQSIAPRKVPAARNPNDVVMVTEPAAVSLGGVKG
jgi:hypothetical protein